MTAREIERWRILIRSSCVGNDAVLSAVDKLAQQAEAWHPIATAPAKGKFLVRTKDGDVVSVSRGGFYPEKFYMRLGGGHYLPPDFLTHWRPL